MNPAQAGTESLPCKVCSSSAQFIGSRRGKFKRELFRLFRCDNCGFAFVGNPWLDYKEIYSAAYYKGEGADALVDYSFELEEPRQTIRQYEWRGILQLVSCCFPLSATTRWLDFGCGNGGLVRYCRDRAKCSISGYEEGAIREEAVKLGIPMLTRDALEPMKSTFDVISAIEVLEHVPEPIAELQRIRSLLRPGGFFFFTTGNAAPHRDRLLQWSYFLPELHISLFEPRTLERALQQTGFRPEFGGFLPGYSDIIRFKILKTLHVRKAGLWEKALPWNLLSRTADSRLHLTAHPVAWAQ